MPATWPQAVVGIVRDAVQSRRNPSSQQVVSVVVAVEEWTAWLEWPALEKQHPAAGATASSCIGGAGQCQRGLQTHSASKHVHGGVGGGERVCIQQSERRIN